MNIVPTLTVFSLLEPRGDSYPRGGEMFFYMHAQMIARKDAEHEAFGWGPVIPFENYSARIDIGIPPEHTLLDVKTAFQHIQFSPRPRGLKLTDSNVKRLQILRNDVDKKIKDKRPKDEKEISIELDNFGKFVEGYLHNTGHNIISYIHAPDQETKREVPPGIMASSRANVRDPIFWRWHKHIDDLSFQWRETLSPRDLTKDAPKVVIRENITGPAVADQSPDIILVFRDQITLSGNIQSIEDWGQQQFGGANNWNKDFRGSVTTE